MRLQKYNLQVMYKKGKELNIADTLSRAYLPEVNASEFIREVEGADHRDGIVITKERWQQLKNTSADDPAQHKLRGLGRSRCLP